MKILNKTDYKLFNKYDRCWIDIKDFGVDDDDDLCDQGVDHKLGQLIKCENKHIIVCNKIGEVDGASIYDNYEECINLLNDINKNYELCDLEIGCTYKINDLNYTYMGMVERTTLREVEGSVIPKYITKRGRGFRDWRCQEITLLSDFYFFKINFKMCYDKECIKIGDTIKYNIDEIIDRQWDYKNPGEDRKHYNNILSIKLLGDK